MAISSFLNHLFRQVTRSSIAAPSPPTPTASRGKRLPSFYSSWTACGRSFGSFPVLLSSMRASWCCFLNMPMPPSLVPSWAAVQRTGRVKLPCADVPDYKNHLFDSFCLISLFGRGWMSSFIFHIFVPLSQSQVVSSWEDGVAVVMGKSTSGAGESDQPTLRGQQSCDLALRGSTESAAVGR